MKSLRSLLSLFIVTAILSLNFTARAATTADEKLKPEEIIAKHLDSIGTKEKLAEIKNLVIGCDVAFTIRGGANGLNGRGVIASELEKTVWAMTLNSNDYPRDTYGFNGKDTKVGYSRPGARSVLGQFIYNYPELLRDGLLGGVLTSSWPLLHADTLKAKISAAGEKKIEVKGNKIDTYVLDFSSKNRSDLSIKMYFDKKTFQHVRTEYNRLISATQASRSSGSGVQGSGIDNSAGQGSERYQLVEDFSDFQAVSGLTIPKTYKLSYDYFNDTTNGTAKKSQHFDYTFTVTSASINQQLDSASFEIAMG